MKKPVQESVRLQGGDHGFESRMRYFYVQNQLSAWF